MRDSGVIHKLRHFLSCHLQIMSSSSNAETAVSSAKPTFQERYFNKVIEWELSRMKNEGFISRNYHRFTSTIIWPVFKPLQSSNPTYYTNREVFHYISFWSMGGCVAGIAAGFLAFLKRRRYRQWVIRQPKDVQIKILAEQNIISRTSSTDMLSENLNTSEYIQSRFSNIPNAMDTRIHLNYSGAYRPNFWWEAGPLKYWNQSSFYPWSSELLLQMGTWAARIGLIGLFTFSIEGAVCKVFGYTLGANVLIRGTAGTISGYMIAKIASEGSLLWYHNIFMALGLGCAWAVATYVNSDFYQIACDNYVVSGLFIPEFNKAFERRYSAKRQTKELAAKQIKDRWEAIQALKTENPQQFKDLTGFDLLLSSLNWEYIELKLQKKGITISEEIESMPFEARQKLETVKQGEEVGIDYNKFPWTYMKKRKPQWFTYTMDDITEENISALIPSSSSSDLSTYDMNTNDPTLLG